MNAVTPSSELDDVAGPVLLGGSPVVLVVVVEGIGSLVDVDGRDGSELLEWSVA